MKALISPIEPVQSGFRVAEVCNSTFDVAQPFFWVDCSDDVVADEFWYDPSDETIKAAPLAQNFPVNLDQPISQGAQTL